MPSRRFSPFESLSVLFHTDSAPGIRPSELSPLTRYSSVSTRKHPRTVSPWSIPAAETVGRPTRPRSLGFHPCEDPWRTDACLAHRTLDAPLGFALLGFSTASLVPAFTGTPLAYLPLPSHDSPTAPAPQGIVNLRLASSASDTRTKMDEATLLGFGTCPIPTIQSQPLRGYEFTSRRVQHCCRPPTILRSSPDSTGVARKGLRCRAIATLTSHSPFSRSTSTIQGKYLLTLRSRIDWQVR